MKKIIYLLLLSSTSWATTVVGNWQVARGALTYTIDHPMKTASGTTHDVKGKGVCQGKECEFLIAAPVKSFDSQSSNRDLHMLEVTKAANNPMTIIRAKCPSEVSNKKWICNLEVTFAGKTQSYTNQEVDMDSLDANQIHAKGVFTLSLKAFDVEPPSLLTIAIKDAVPVQYDVIFVKGSK